MISLNMPTSFTESDQIDNLLTEVISTDTVETNPDGSLLPVDSTAQVMNPGMDSRIDAQIVENSIPRSLSTYPVREFLSCLNWKNDANYQWPPVPKAFEVEAPLTTEELLDEQEIPLPIGSIPVRQFLQLVNWANQSLAPALPTRKIEGKLTLEANLSLDGMLSSFAWD